MDRFIVHVDMDAFFAAIEQRDDPALAGKPVIIGADPKEGKGRGVVATCSYEARAYGIHSAMPISRAFQKCPRGKFLPVSMDKYIAESERILSLLYLFTPCVEPVSIDEAFLDITGSLHLFDSPGAACLKIKDKIRSETGLSASIGLAPIKMAAKIASDLCKPDGFLKVSRKGLLEFLRPLEVSRMWGIGKKSEDILKRMGIRTIGDIAARDVDQLVSVLGINGRHIRELARGIDPRPVGNDDEAKSVSNEHTFERDSADRSQIESVLMFLCEKVSGRLRGQGLKGKTVTLKVRRQGFETHTRSVTMAAATNYVEDIFRAVKKLFSEFDPARKKIRLVGVKLSNFSPGQVQYDLFHNPVKTEHLHQAIDTLKEKFGERIIFRAAGKKDE